MQAWWSENYGGFDKFYKRNSIQPQIKESNDLSSIYSSSTVIHKPELTNTRDVSIGDEVFNKYMELIPSNPYDEDDAMTSISVKLSRRKYNSTPPPPRAPGHTIASSRPTSFIGIPKKGLRLAPRNLTLDDDNKPILIKSRKSKNANPNYQQHCKLRSEHFKDINGFINELSRQHSSRHRQTIRSASCLIPKDSCQGCGDEIKDNNFIEVDEFKYHKNCVHCFDCQNDSHSTRNIDDEKFFIHEMMIKKHFDIEKLIENNDDNVSITAPLRTNNYLSSSSSISPINSTFDDKYPTSPTLSSSSIISNNFNKVSTSKIIPASFFKTKKAQKRIYSGLEEFVEKNVLLCEYHMYLKMNLICLKCDSPIKDDECYENNSIHYHLECINSMYCDNCGIDLTNNNDIKVVEKFSENIKYYDNQCFKQMLFASF